MDIGTDDDSHPAHEQVRRALAELGSDEASAPDVPAVVTARIGTALRAAGDGPSHSIDRPRLRRLQVLGLVVGVGAALVGVAVGALMLARDPAPSLPMGPTAKQITVSPPGFPLSEPQIGGLLTRAADYGPLADPQRLASCLAGLGYPATAQVLGAQPLDMHGTPGVLMLLPGDTDDAVVAVVVEPDCSAAHTGQLARTVVTRP